MSHLRGLVPMLVNELLIINFQLVDQAAFLMPASVWQLIVLPLHGHFEIARVSPGRCLLLPGPCAEGARPQHSAGTSDATVFQGWFPVLCWCHKSIDDWLCPTGVDQCNHR